MRKLFDSIVAGALFLIPFWIWLAMYLLVAPDTALARLLVVGFGLYFLGFAQFACALFYVLVVLPIIWAQPPAKRRA